MALFIEMIMENYKPFYLQKEAGPVKDSYAEWNMHIQSFPVIYCPTVKEYAKNDWKDQDGDDEYIPQTPVYKAYEMKIGFLYVGPKDSFNLKIKAFWEYVRSGEFKIFDTHTGIGRQKVRYVSYDPNSFYRRNNGDIVQFSMTFKINDPITEITLNI